MTASHAFILLCIHLQEPIPSSMADEDYFEVINDLECNNYIHKEDNFLSRYAPTDKGKSFISAIELITI